jgi:hypothetical protein
MTPKQKARQLVERFYFALPNNGSQTGVCNVHQRWEEGKMCAAMAVDEILAGYMGNPKVKYWKEVQQEIEKL